MGWEKKRKSGAYEVVSRAETDDGYVISKDPIVRNENSYDLWLQAAAKRLKTQISNSDILAADVFYYKTCYDRFVYFYRKIPKENPLLNKEVSNQFSKKEFLVLMKLLSSDLVVELQQLYEMYCINENIRDNKKMKHFLQENFKESICFTPICWIHGNPIVGVNCINHWGWAAWWRDHNFFCKDDPSKNKSSRNWNNFPIICWKFIWSKENAIYIKFF